MALTNSQYNELMRRYSRIRFQHQHEMEERLRHIYAQCPRLLEISKLLPTSSAALAKAKITGNKAQALNAQMQIDVVEEVLSWLEASGIPQILVLNKCDKESAADVFTSSAKRNVKISATERLNFDELYSAIEDLLSGDKIRIELVIPYDKYSLMSFVRENGSIIEERHEDDGTHVTALMDEADSQKLRAMLEK